MTARALIALSLAGCFGKGGGQVSSEGAARAAIEPGNPYDVVVPPGYRIEVVADHLTFPTGIAIAPTGERYVVEAGYAYGEVFARPRLLQLFDGGRVRELATGDGAPWNGVVYHDGALVVAEGGEVDGGRIVRFDRDGNSTVLVEHLPSLGDHHTNGPAVSRDGWVYFGQGTVTNSGVVGTDAERYGWLPRHPHLHDIPCHDLKLAGLSWRTGDRSTGAFHAFGTSGPEGEVIPGELPCSGAVMRVPVNGGPIELVASGFRNPFGLAFDGRGQLFVDDNGYDVRGSRPVFGAADVMWRVEPGRWYGWPDYAEGRPLTLEWYSEDGGPPLGFVLAEHPPAPPDPAVIFAVHSSSDGFDFSRDAAFGHVGDAFVAQFGDLAPTTGKVFAPVGFEVVRANPVTGAIEDFARNRGDRSGPASQLGTRGLERPIAARFDPSGRALYVVDFGVIRVTETGLEPQPGTGRVWRITRRAADAR